MSYTEAKAKYAALGIDTDAAIEKMKTVPVALHCWQATMSVALILTPTSLSPEASRPLATTPAGPEPPRS